jgi:hypothetical protein
MSFYGMGRNLSKSINKKRKDRNNNCKNNGKSIPCRFYLKEHFIQARGHIDGFFEPKGNSCWF